MMYCKMQNCCLYEFYDPYLKIFKQTQACCHYVAFLICCRDGFTAKKENADSDYLFAMFWNGNMHKKSRFTSPGQTGKT